VDTHAFADCDSHSDIDRTGGTHGDTAADRHANCHYRAIADAYTYGDTGPRAHVDSGRVDHTYTYADDATADQHKHTFGDSDSLKFYTSRPDMRPARAL